jgi:hypothetical protein
MIASKFCYENVAHLMRTSSIERLGLLAIIVCCCLIIFSQTHERRKLQQQDENRFTKQQHYNLRVQHELLVSPLLFPQLYQCIAPQPSQIEEFHSQSHEDKWLYDQIFLKLSESELLGGTRH